MRTRIFALFLALLTGCNETAPTAEQLKPDPGEKGEKTEISRDEGAEYLDIADKACREEPAQFD
jgi:hypothetical protein